MKLSSIKQKIELAIPLIDSISIGTVTIQGNNYRKVANLSSFRKGINLLRQTGIFENFNTFFENDVLFTINEDSINILIPEFADTKENIDALMRLANSLVLALDKVIPEVPENTIYIKLPD